MIWHALIWKYWSTAKASFQWALLQLGEAEIQKKWATRRTGFRLSCASSPWRDCSVWRRNTAVWISSCELPRWCSVRGCLEDNVTIRSLLASPKRYREFQIPNFIYILGSTPKFQSPIMTQNMIPICRWGTGILADRPKNSEAFSRAKTKIWTQKMSLLSCRGVHKSSWGGYPWQQCASFV